MQQTIRLLNERLERTFQRGLQRYGMDYRIEIPQRTKKEEETRRLHISEAISRVMESFDGISRGDM